MRKSVKIALATSALAVGGGLFLATASFAERGFGHGPMGMMGPMHGLGMEMIQGVDANKDGSLSQEEVNNAVNARFAEFDADKNGSLSLPEFEALWAEITKPVAVRAFQFLDPDGDAAVAKAELDQRFGTIVSHLDRNDDGVLSRDDRPQHRGPGGRWHGPWGGGQQDDGPDGDSPAQE
jgi:EF hand domain-containing protein